MNIHIFVVREKKVNYWKFKPKSERILLQIF